MAERRRSGKVASKVQRSRAARQNATTKREITPESIEAAEKKGGSSSRRRAPTNKKQNSDNAKGKKSTSARIKSVDPRAEAAAKRKEEARQKKMVQNIIMGAVGFVVVLIIFVIATGGNPQAERAQELLSELRDIRKEMSDASYAGDQAAVNNLNERAQKLLNEPEISKTIGSAGPEYTIPAQKLEEEYAELIAETKRRVLRQKVSGNVRELRARLNSIVYEANLTILSRDCRNIYLNPLKMDGSSDNELVELMKNDLQPINGYKDLIQAEEERRKNKLPVPKFAEAQKIFENNNDLENRSVRTERQTAEKTIELALEKDDFSSAFHGIRMHMEKQPGLNLEDLWKKASEQAEQRWKEDIIDLENHLDKSNESKEAYEAFRSLARNLIDRYGDPQYGNQIRDFIKQAPEQAQAEED